MTRRRWLVGLILVFGVWTCVVGARVWAAYGHDRQGLAALDAVRSHTDPSALTTSATTSALDQAKAAFDAASGDLSGPWLFPVDVLPVLGRQVRSARSLSMAASAVSGIGSTFLVQVHGVLDQPHGAGLQRVAALKHLSFLATEASRRLNGVDPGSSTALIGPLASRRALFVRQLADVQGRLQRSATTAAVVAGVLQGPTTFLVLAGNNAEMRAGSGAFLEIGTATALDGTVHLSDLGPSGDRALPFGLVTATGDLERNWGWLHPGVDWRNLGVTPEFDVTASLAAKMWTASTGQSVDGVLALDVVGLQKILAVTGPVQIGTHTIDASNVESYVLHDQYAGLSDSATADAGRQDALGSLASAVLRQLQGQSIDLRSLASAMAGAVAGRHLMVWSPDRSVEANWQAVGAAGQLRPDSVDVAVINRGANKLDPFLSVTVRVDIRPDGENSRLTMTLALANQVPEGESQFVAGPYPGLGLNGGDYSGLIAVNVPAAATHRSLTGIGPLAADGPEGPTWLLAAPVLLPAGGRQTATVRFVLPGRHGAMTIVPSARVPTETWIVHGQPQSDEVPRTIRW